MKTSPKNYTNLEKSSRTSLNVPGKMALRIVSLVSLVAVAVKAIFGTLGASDLSSCR